MKVHSPRPRLARFAAGRLVPSANVERCNACRRFHSDEAARRHLLELGLADPDLSKTSRTAACRLYQKPFCCVTSWQLDQTTRSDFIGRVLKAATVSVFPGRLLVRVNSGV